MNLLQDELVGLTGSQSKEFAPHNRLQNVAHVRLYSATIRTTCCPSVSCIDGLYRRKFDIMMSSVATRSLVAYVRDQMGIGCWPELFAMCWADLRQRFTSVVPLLDEAFSAQLPFEIRRAIASVCSICPSWPIVAVDTPVPYVTVTATHVHDLLLVVTASWSAAFWFQPLVSFYRGRWHCTRLRSHGSRRH